MEDFAEQLRERLIMLIEQAAGDRDSLKAPEYEHGRVLFDQLFDSLTATLHNLNGEKTIDTDRDE